jgi:hypothetical protein
MADPKPTKIIKIDVYLGYHDAGTSMRDAIREYAFIRKLSVSKLVVEALRTAYPDLKI